MAPLGHMPRPACQCGQDTDFWVAQAGHRFHPGTDESPGLLLKGGQMLTREVENVPFMYKGPIVSENEVTSQIQTPKESD